MPDIAQRLGRDMLVIEGAMGTMLAQAQFVSERSAPELANIVEPDLVTQIHRYYAFAGADCAVSNTFGATAPNLAKYGLAKQIEAINRAGMKLARRGGAPHILADIGPCGLMLAPLGNATFDEVYDAFNEQIIILAQEKPDAFLLETFTDIAELRVAVLACKERAPDIPVLASISCNADGRMELSGTDPATAAIILEAAGADAVGMNCGIGPMQMLPLVRQMVSATRLPVFAQPNAGLPTADSTGDAVFPGTAQEMGQFAQAAFEAGVALIGSCCGSTPEFTGAIADEISSETVRSIEGRGFLEPVVASARRHVVIGRDAVTLIGERINATGKDEFTDELLAGTFETALRLAREQEADGADMLDVNVGAAGVDEVAVLTDVVRALSEVTNLPLVIDTSDVEALAEALRVYPGRALINSVNGDPASYEPVFALAQRYGACLIALALDDQGIPATTEGRLAVVEEIRARAHEQGIGDDRLIFDALVMTQAVDSEAPAVTLETTKAIRERGLKTVLGISNVSFGMPDRQAVNAQFFAHATDAGLDAAIVNVAEIKQHGTSPTGASSQVIDLTKLSMLELADKFKSGEIFLPQLMSALDALKKQRGRSRASATPPRETVVFATVAGDIHSIGKDICVALLESQRFEVVDLGVDVPVKKVVSVARDIEPLAVCLSALMTTTLPAMESTIATLRKYLPQTPVCVGGAVVTKQWADGVSALYSEDAPSCVALIESLERV